MRYLKQLILMLFSISLLYSADAFGLASSYLENNTMILSPGEIKEYKVEIQNNDANEIKAKFVLESDIAKIADEKEEYSVGNKTPIREISLIVTAPIDALPGQEFIVRYWTYPLASEDTPISISLRLNREFKVKIKEEKQDINISNMKKKKLLNNTLLGIAMLIIISIVVLLLLKKSHMFSKRIFR